MSCLEFSAKDPAEVIVYGFDFTSLLDDGEAITSSVWSLSVDTAVGTDTTTLELVGVADISGAPIVRHLIRLGTAGFTYFVTCEVVTDAGQTLRARARLPVRTGPC